MGLFDFLKKKKQPFNERIKTEPMSKNVEDRSKNPSMADTRAEMKSILDERHAQQMANARGTLDTGGMKIGNVFRKRRKNMDENFGM